MVMQAWRGGESRRGGSGEVKGDMRRWRGGGVDKRGLVVVVVVVVVVVAVVVQQEVKRKNKRDDE